MAFSNIISYVPTESKISMYLNAISLLLVFFFFCCTATESDPLSVCAYCSDRRAGVRWMIHESNNQKDLWEPGRYDEISIEFQCRDPQNDIVSSNNNDNSDNNDVYTYNIILVGYMCSHDHN